MRNTSMPLSTGMSQSSSMTSGSAVRIASRAARPSEASSTDLPPRLVHPRQTAHIGVIIDHQDIETLDHFFDLLVGHETPNRRAQNRTQFRSKVLLFC